MNFHFTENSDFGNFILPDILYITNSHTQDKLKLIVCDTQTDFVWLEIFVVALWILNVMALYYFRRLLINRTWFDGILIWYFTVVFFHEIFKEKKKNNIEKLETIRYFIIIYLFWTFWKL